MPIEQCTLDTTYIYGMLFCFLSRKKSGTRVAKNRAKEYIDHGIFDKKRNVFWAQPQLGILIENRFIHFACCLVKERGLFRSFF
jgi:hypothetical protein